MFFNMTLLDKHSNKNLRWKHLYCRMIFTLQKRLKLNALWQIGFVFHTAAPLQKTVHSKNVAVIHQEISKCIPSL